MGGNTRKSKVRSLRKGGSVGAKNEFPQLTPTINTGGPRKSRTEWYETQ